MYQRGVTFGPGPATFTVVKRLLALLAAAACSGGNATPPPGGPTPATVRLSGTVQNGAGATVFAGGRSAVVGADGRYTLEGLPEGGTVVVATGAGRHDDVAVASLRPPETRLDLALASSDGSLELAFTGDVAFSARTRATPEDEAGWAALVAEIAPLTARASVAVVTLESVLAEPGTPHPGRPLLLRSPPASIGALRELRAGVVVLATDHIYDYLDEGVLDTLERLRAAGMTPVGAGRDENEARANPILTLNGMSVGFVAQSALTGRGEELPVAEPPFFDATPSRAGAARLDPLKLEAAVADLRARADRVVVLLHGGRERGEVPAVEVATAARRAIDAGADLVVASHPRAVQGIERYRDRLVVYSLGAFVFDDDEPEGWAGAVLRVRLPKSGPIEHIRLLPVYSEGLVPAAATGGLRARILERFAERSAPLGVTVLSDGRVLPRPPAELPATEESGERSAPVVSVEGTMVSFTDDRARGARLSRLELLEPADASLWSGRDLLLGGDLEDDLADGRFGAPAGLHFPSDAEKLVTDSVEDGRLSLAICRSGTTRSTASASSSGRYPVGPAVTVSLCGCWRGDAGTTGAARLLFYESLAEDAGAVESRAIVSGPPPGDWGCFCGAASGPLGARFVEVRLEHTPTADSSACVGFDDLRLVAWELHPERSVTLGPQSGVGYARVTGVGAASEVRVGFTLRTLEEP